MSPWVDPDRDVWVHHPVGDAGWGRLLAQCGAAPGDPLERVFSVARAQRSLTVVEENRYVDPDYRSEYSAFWSHRFPTWSSFGRRLHFFKRKLDRDDLFKLSNHDPSYVGYSILKPIRPGRVGRTMLTPPPRLAKARLTLVTETVSLFGTELTVTGAPFMEQDTEYLRCAHAAAWVCHYHAAQRRLVGRTVTARLVEMSPTTMSAERSLPSPGLNLNQLQAVFAATGQPALFYGLSNMPVVRGVEQPTPKLLPNGKQAHPGYWDTRIFSVVCRYLNAGFPVLVGTLDHAFVIVGWFREGKRIRFVACDDQWGPYETITSPFTHRSAPWNAFMVPLPPRVYLSGEAAESAAHLWIRAQGGSSAPPAWQEVAAKLDGGEVSLRTFLRSNLEYKRGVATQARDVDVTRGLRSARLPHYVWVVEAHIRKERIAGRPSVVAEYVLDSTSSEYRMSISAVSLLGATRIFPPDDGAIVAIPAASRAWTSLL